MMAHIVYSGCDYAAAPLQVTPNVGKKRVQAIKLRLETDVFALLESSGTPPRGLNAWGCFKAAMKKYRINVVRFIPVIEIIIEHMVRVTETTWLGLSWRDSWKPVSKEGYDTVKGGLGFVDYGNQEYSTLMEVLSISSPRIWSLVERLGAHFPSVVQFRHGPDLSETNYGTERQADVIEVVLAALRGHKVFEDIFSQIYQRFDTKWLPPIFAEFCEVLRAQHMMDGWFITGTIKWRQHESVPKVQEWNSNLSASRFVQCYRDPQQKSVALCSLLV